MKTLVKYVLKSNPSNMLIHTPEHQNVVILNGTNHFYSDMNNLTICLVVWKTFLGCGFGGDASFCAKVQT